MSFAEKANRPDSGDTKKLRKEYTEAVRKFHESSDPASRTKLKDDKAKAFARVREQIVHERRENLRSLHKVLTQQGSLKPKAEKK